MALSLIPFTNLTLIKRLIFSLDQFIFSLYIIDKRTTRFKEDRQLEPSTP